MDYIGYTLVDITCTNVQTQTDDKPRNQQRNWEAVLAVLNFRTTPTITSLPVTQYGNIAAFLFGTHYTGDQIVWAFSFRTDDLTDMCSIINNDIDYVPIVLNLDETANIPSAMFFLNHITRNIYIEAA